MKITNKLKALFFILFSFGFVHNAFAVGVPINWDDLNSNHGFVYRLIKLLFGNFINLYGGSTDNNAASDYTILASLGVWSCWAAFVLGVILVVSQAFNFYRWAEDPAKHGVRDGMLLFKAGIILFLIIPLAQGGVSFAQRVTVIKTALMGDAFANKVYSVSVDKMLSPPKLTNTSVNASKIAAAIFQAEVCSYGVGEHSVSQNTQLEQVFNGSSIIPMKSGIDIIYTMSNMNEVTGRYKKIQVSVDNNTSRIIFAPKSNYTAQGFSATGACGELQFPEAKDGTSVFDQVLQSQSSQLKQAVTNLVNNIAPAASVIFSVTSQKDHNANIATNGSPQVQQAVEAALKQYNYAVNEYVKEVQSIPSKINTTILTDNNMRKFVEDSGWGLGMIWWKMLADTQSSFIQNAMNFNNSMSSKIFPICDHGSIYTFFFGEQYCVEKTYYDLLTKNVKNFLDEINGSLAAEGGTGQQVNISAKFSSLCGASGCSYETVDNWLGRVMKTMLASSTDSEIYNQAINDSSVKDITNFQNQKSIFDVAANLGSVLMGMSSTMFGFAAGLYTISGGLQGVDSTVAGWFGAGIASHGLASMLTFLANVLSTGAYLLVVPAGTLLVALPFIPIVIWTMLVLSYLIMLVEAYIAVPLGMALWIMPDEIFLSGRMLRTIMMISSLFLRPFLFVVGLITTYALAPLALTIWNTMFFWGSSFLTTGGYLTSLALIFVYVAGLVKFTMMTYNVAFILPDKILQWMGSGFGDVAAFGSPADFGSSVGGVSGSPKGGGGGNLGYQAAVAGGSAMIGASYQKSKDAKAAAVKPTSSGGMPLASGVGGGQSSGGSSTSNVGSALSSSMGMSSSSGAGSSGSSPKSYPLARNGDDPTTVDFGGLGITGSVKKNANPNNPFHY